MDSSFWFATINLEWSIVFIKGLQVIIFIKNGFVLKNSGDLDEMPHNAAFHLGLHCLPKYAFRTN